MVMFMRALILLAVAAAADADAAISLTVNSKTGAYAVAMGGDTWFTSGATAYTTGYKTLSTADGSLKLAGASSGSGSDASGAFTSTTLEWDGGAYVTQFRQYHSMVVFEQRFPKGVQGTSTDQASPYDARDQVSSSFPSFATTTTTSPVGRLAFSGDMTGSDFKYGRGTRGVPTGVKGFGPTCFYSQDLKQSVVLSSFSQFMAASNGPAANGTAYGLQGSITDVPAGYSLSFVLAASSEGGVNRAFEEWGSALLHRYGKSRAQTYEDYGLNYLSYSTDNGAYYYYQTEGHAAKRGPPYTPGETYQQTLMDVKAYSVAQAIPYKYILLDSWWYYQGVGGGVTNWIGRPDVFPQGNSYLRNVTGWPIMGHNRYWAVDNVYCTQNGGEYDFVVEKKGEGAHFNNFAWPTEQRFWDDLMYNSSQWGLVMYEQDWLDTEYDNVLILNTNATAGRTWLMQMGTAAARNDLTIQYCMSHCRHIMQSVELPAVTNARASGDYHPGGDQWRPLGTTGIFAWALAIAPTKDNYWSTDVQTGSAYGDHATVREPHNRLQAAVSTLSKGPVAPSDKIGRSDAALILKSCAADGKLLQGDKPAMVIDAQHLRKAFGSHGSGGAARCRVTVTPDPCPLHASNGGYSAYTPMNKKSGGGYTTHGGDFCDCGGDGNCDKWAYESTNKDDLAACEAKCTALNCSCFDFIAPQAASNYSGGPDGEVWVTHTELSHHSWAVAMAATLKSNYSLSLADMALPPSTGGAGAAQQYVYYEANSTDTVVRGSAIELAACDKWDFQLYAVAPVLPNGIALLGEPSKWVPVSNARFSELASSTAAEGAAAAASVTARGPEGEKVSVAWLMPGASTPTLVHCTMPRGSAVSVRISTAMPKGECVEL